MRANVSYGNGVVTVTLPRADRTSASTIRVQRTGHARGVAAGHAGERGGTRDDPPGDASRATTVKV